MTCSHTCCILTQIVCEKAHQFILPVSDVSKCQCNRTFYPFHISMLNIFQLQKSGIHFPSSVANETKMTSFSVILASVAPSVRGRSQLSSFSRVYKEYTFWCTPLPRKRTLKNDDTTCFFYDLPRIVLHLQIYKSQDIGKYTNNNIFLMKVKTASYYKNTL